MGLTAHSTHRIQSSCISTFPFLFSLPPFSAFISFSVILLCGFCLAAGLLLLHLPSSQSPFSLYFRRCCLSGPCVHLQVFSFEIAEIGDNVTGEPKVRKGSLFILTVLYFPFTSLSSVFLIDWPGGLADPEKDERAEQNKELGLWTRHALLLAYTDRHTLASPQRSRIHAHTGGNTQLLCQRHGRNVHGYMEIGIYEVGKA